MFQEPKHYCFPRLPDIVRERLLRINMYASLHRRKCGGKMRVVGSRNHYGINLFLQLIEHHSKVIEEWLRGAPILHVLRAMIAIHIAERDEVFLAAALLVGLLGNPTARADEGDVELTIRGLSSLADSKWWKHRAAC